VFDARDPLLDGAPDATIDLHRLTTFEARQYLMTELKALSRSAKGGIVHVITGRGMHSDGGAVLRPFVRSLLNGSLRGHVADVAPTMDGGGFRVRLK
jgi:DNA-nicking Smr family endonuclease